ncbi:hypothetical protein ACOMHN_048430 [Nucella lapillus]
MGVQKPLQFIKSLYTDPFRWNLVKSTVVFFGAIYIARELATAEKAAQNLAPGV